MVGSRILRVTPWGAAFIIGAVCLVSHYSLRFLWRAGENEGYRSEQQRQQAVAQALEMVNGDGVAQCFDGENGYYRCKVLRRPLPPITFFCTHELCWAP